MNEHSELRRLIGVVGELRKDIPLIGGAAIDDFMERPKTAHRKAAETVFHRLASQEDAQIRETLGGTQIILADVKARSTRGPDAALANWQRAAELKLKMENRHV